MVTLSGQLRRAGLVSALIHRPAAAAEAGVSEISVSAQNSCVALLATERLCGRGGENGFNDGTTDHPRSVGARSNGPLSARVNRG